MKNLFDIHTHTVICAHAYSTVKENVEEASKKGLELIAITEHAPSLPGSSHEFFFSNIHCIPSQLMGVEVLKGVELNILDEGEIDLPIPILKNLDIAIASLHPPCFLARDSSIQTKAILKVMENPYVNIIGHLCDSRYPFDFKAVAKKARETGTIIEINNSSLLNNGARKVIFEEMDYFINLCVEEGVLFELSSDAHFYTAVGNIDKCLEYVKRLNIPNELILNYSIENLKKSYTK